MHWKLKAAAFQAFDLLPAGDFLYHQMQERVTGTAMRDMSGGTTNKYHKVFTRHLTEFARCGKPPGEIRYLEFGAGYDLAANLYNYCFGIDSQVLVDITPIMRIDQVLRLAKWLQVNPPPGASRPAKSELSEMGIAYRAPMRIQEVSGKFDVISTIDTLEHIPFAELPSIMAACRRLLDETGVCVMSIDYTDHYSHADPSITPYNFLRYSQDQWNKYNARRHYQSRARHPQYREVFKAAAFVSTEIYIERPEGWQERLASVPLHRDFQNFEPEDTAIQRATFVLT